MKEPIWVWDRGKCVSIGKREKGRGSKKRQGGKGRGSKKREVEMGRWSKKRQGEKGRGS